MSGADLEVKLAAALDAAFAAQVDRLFAQLCVSAGQEAVGGVHHPDARTCFRTGLGVACLMYQEMRDRR
jgi:hypothetical protein